ncbi:MAG: NAD-binding protein, partial [Thermodesulfobacteriota bacterium]
MLDAPVSGGEIGAIQGTLAIMVGGEEKVFKECMEIFNALGKSIVYVGEIGSGGYVKLVNQIIVALNIATLGEAFSLGVKAGLDPQVIYQAIRGGLAGSQVMETKMPMILQRNYKPGFKIRLHQKDIQNALSTARDLGLPMFLTSFVQQILTSLIQEGKGEEDHSGIVTFFEKISGIQIGSS